MDSLTTMPIITTTWMTTKMSIMPTVSIVTTIRINNNLHVHHVDHAQAEKDAAMKQAESASRAAEMFMKVFIVRYKLSFNLTRNLLETLPSCFSKNLSIVFIYHASPSGWRLWRQRWLWWCWWGNIHTMPSQKKCQFHLFLVYILLPTRYYLILAEMKAELEKAKKEAEAAKKVGLQGWYNNFFT